jgi:hypothetical protein
LDHSKKEEEEEGKKARRKDKITEMFYSLLIV